MANLERTHLSQEMTGAMMEQLDQDQSVLNDAEVEGAAGAAHAKKIVLFVAVLSLAAGALIVMRKRRSKPNEN